MKRKKICFVTTIGGTINAFLTGLAQYLVEKRHYDVTYICAPDNKLAESQNEHIHFLPVPMSRGINMDAFRVIGQLTRIFREQQFDIVQYATPNAALYASIAAKRAGVKNRLYTQWGIRYMGYDGGVRRWVFKTLEKMICSRSTVIECESFSLQDFSIAEGLYPARKSSVIGKGSACGVNLEKAEIDQRETWRKEIRSQLGIADDAFVFGYMGRITRDKGMNELIAAFREFQKSNSQAILLLVGGLDNEGTIEKDLFDWAKESPKVLLPGRTSTPEKFYAAMDVFCSLSYREGFGLVVIEAAAMALPAIVTNVPGQRDTIIEHETGISVNAKEVKPVVEAMRFYVSHKSETIDMGKKARRNVEDNYEQQGLFKLLADHRDMIIDSTN